MRSKNIASLAILMMATGASSAPVASAAEGCRPGETSLLIRGDGFAAIPVQIKSGSIRLGSLEFSFMGEETGWTVSKPADAAGGPAQPATQITISKAVLEIRSLDRRLGSVDESPDAVLTAVSGQHGLEIRVSARGTATLVLGGHEQAKAPKELAFSCDGISLSANPSVI
jgi:hypothetical protein